MNDAPELTTGAAAPVADGVNGSSVCQPPAWATSRRRPARSSIVTGAAAGVDADGAPAVV